MNIKWLILSLVRLYGAIATHRFRSALKSPRRAQRRVLGRIVRGLRKTEYGQYYGIKSIDDFKRVLPLVEYDDIEPWIEQQKTYEKSAVVERPVLFYEKTSGSSGAQKYIPYTGALRRSFTHMFLLWFYDLLMHLPELDRGRGIYYISVSPNFDPKECTEKGVPVSLDTDADYLGSVWRALLGSFLLMVDDIGGIKDPECFRKTLAVELLKREDLEAISIWNPAFLTVLLEWIVEHRQLLLDELQGQLSSVEHQRLVVALTSEAVDWTQVWPKLRLVSCWADGSAKPLANKLREMMPNVTIQGKGLLATEAPITFPMLGSAGGAPLLTDIYLEFIDKERAIRELHELEQGEVYEVVITHNSGLYRYRLGDRVQVVGWQERTPMLTFIGRTSQVSDLVGEKLNETFVEQAITALNLREMSSSFLLAVREPNDGYVLVTEAVEEHQDQVAERLEQGLSAAYHFRQARALGQLAAVRVAMVKNLDRVVARYAVNVGKRLGGVKHRFLVPPDRMLARELGLI